MAELTADRIRELLSYNPITGELTWIAKTSGRRKQGGKAGSKMKMGYLEIGIDGTSYLTHRVVWMIVHGHWPSDQIDHINGIRDDNNPDNLELWLGAIRYGQRAKDVVCPHCKKAYLE